MQQPKEVIKDWIDRVNTEGRGLTAWEEGYMEDITDQFETCGRLTDKQEEILERIYAQRTR